MSENLVSYINNKYDDDDWIEMVRNFFKSINNPKYITYIDNWEPTVTFEELEYE